MFQFYNVRHLWRDIRIAAGARLVADPSGHGAGFDGGGGASRHFGLEWVNHLPNNPPAYDLRTRHAALYGGTGGYICHKMRVLAELADFVRTQKEQKRCA